MADYDKLVLQLMKAFAAGVPSAEAATRTMEQHKKLEEERRNDRHQWRLEMKQRRREEERAEREHASLPLFNGAAKCAKCHNEEVRTGFVSSRRGAPAYMKRTCDRCGYTWKERPLDEAEDIELLAREAPGKKP